MEFEHFLSLYNDLEKDIKRVFNLRDNISAVAFYLNTIRSDEYDFERLDQIRKIRNLFVHQTVLSDYLPIKLEDSLEADLNHFINLVKSANNLMVEDVMTDTKTIVSLSINSRVDNILPYMIKRGLSYLPVVNKNKTIGIFSKTSVLRIVHKKLEIDSDLRIKDVLDFVKIDDEEVRFIKINSCISEAKSCFLNKKTRIILVTDDGSQSGDLLGIISPIDLYK